MFTLKINATKSLKIFSDDVKNLFSRSFSSSAQKHSLATFCLPNNAKIYLFGLS